MISMSLFLSVRALHEEGVPKKKIARQLGVDPPEGRRRRQEVGLASRVSTRPPGGHVSCPLRGHLTCPATRTQAQPATRMLQHQPPPAPLSLGSGVRSHDPERDRRKHEPRDGFPERLHLCRGSPSGPDRMGTAGRQPVASWSGSDCGERCPLEVRLNQVGSAAEVVPNRPHSPAHVGTLSCLSLYMRLETSQERSTRSCESGPITGCKITPDERQWPDGSPIHDQYRCAPARINKPRNLAERDRSLEHEHDWPARLRTTSWRFKSGGGGESPVGRQGACQEVVRAVGAGFGALAVIQEIAHAVGRSHERRDHDRDRFVRYYSKNVQDGNGPSTITRGGDLPTETTDMMGPTGL